MRLRAAELVVVAPLPPRRSGIAAYTAELVAELGRHRRCVVVVEHQADVVETPGALVLSQARYLGEPALHGLPHLHQLGNNPDHHFVHRFALRRPGVVALHDPVLHHMVEEMALSADDPAGYDAALALAAGPAGPAVAALRRAGVFGEAWRYRLALNEAVLAAARGVLVHSRWAAARLRHPRVRALAHHVSPRVAAYDSLSQAAARAALDLPQDLPVLLSLGFVSAPKQVPLVLEALAGLRAEGLGFRYVIAGALDPSLGIPRLVARLGLQDCVDLPGWVEEERFFTLARAADLLVNLRFPVGGESSGTLARALGMGLPALVYDLGPAAEWPDQAVVKLPFAAGPGPALRAALGRLLADRAGLAARGRLARMLARAQCSVHRSAAVTLAALDEWCGPQLTS